MKLSLWRSGHTPTGIGTLYRACLMILCLGTLFGVPDGVTAQSAASRPLRLRPGDAIRLAVLDEPRLTADVPVLDDGTALFPVIGFITITDADFAEVERRIRSAYTKEITTRHVVVQALVRIAVLGEVRIPGLYMVDRTHKLADVIARAGGLAPSAARNRILLIREGVSNRLDMNSGALSLGEVRPGDQIIVERRSWVSENVPILIGTVSSVVAAVVTALLVR